MILPILKTYIHFKDKFSYFKIHFYDDGSEGIVTLYQFTPNKLQQSINLNKSILCDLVNGKTIRILEPYIFRYLWSNVLDCEYHFFDTRLLNTNNLYRLAQEIKSIKKIELTKYHALNKEQKELILDILNISYSIEEQFSILSENHKICLFIGTTVFNEADISIPLLEKIHINAIKEFTLPNGKYFYRKYDFLFIIKVTLILKH